MSELTIDERIEAIDKLLGDDIAIVRGVKIENNQLSPKPGIQVLDATGIYMDGVGLLVPKDISLKLKYATIMNAPLWLEYKGEIKST